MKSIRNKKTEVLTVCIGIGMVAGSVLSASAEAQPDRDTDQTVGSRQQQAGEQQRHEPGARRDAQADVQRPRMEQDGDSGRQAPAMARASKIIGMEVHGQDGRKLGDLEELILSQDRRRVEYLEVSLDDGDRVRLSLDAFSARPGDDDVLLVRASNLQQETQDRDRAWADDGEQDAHASRRVSQLIGMDVQGTDGDEVGSINDLIVDSQSGQVKTAAIATGGFFGIGRRLASVEWQQVRIAADGESASIDMTQDQLSERAHKQNAYWDSHAFAGREGQYDATGRIQGQDEDLERDARTATDITKADNTGRNARDRDGATLTSFDQGNSKADVDTTAQIRKAVNASENMSMSGKNVKIITRDGQVTLRGPVDNAEEKRLIGEIANRIARAENVDNQLEVKSTTSVSSY